MVIFCKLKFSSIFEYCPQQQQEQFQITLYICFFSVFFGFFGFKFSAENRKYLLSEKTEKNFSVGKSTGDGIYDGNSVYLGGGVVPVNPPQVNCDD